MLSQKVFFIDIDYKLFKMTRKEKQENENDLQSNQIDSNFDIFKSYCCSEKTQKHIICMEVFFIYFFNLIFIFMLMISIIPFCIVFSISAYLGKKDKNETEYWEILLYVLFQLFFIYLIYLYNCY